MNAHDRATDLGIAPTTAPVAWFCVCGEPTYVGNPDNFCDTCGETREL